MFSQNNEAEEFVRELRFKVGLIFNGFLWEFKGVRAVVQCLGYYVLAWITL